MSRIYVLLFVNIFIGTAFVAQAADNQWGQAVIEALEQVAKDRSRVSSEGGGYSSKREQFERQMLRRSVAGHTLVEFSNPAFEGQGGAAAAKIDRISPNSEQVRKEYESMMYRAPAEQEISAGSFGLEDENRLRGLSGGSAPFEESPELFTQDSLEHSSLYSGEKKAFCNSWKCVDRITIVGSVAFVGFLAMAVVGGMKVANTKAEHKNCCESHVQGFCLSGNNTIVTNSLDKCFQCEVNQTAGCQTGTAKDVSDKPGTYGDALLIFGGLGAFITIVVLISRRVNSFTGMPLAGR